MSYSSERSFGKLYLSDNGLHRFFFKYRQNGPLKRLEADIWEIATAAIAEQGASIPWEQAQREPGLTE